jgi:hypothetical protein
MALEALTNLDLTLLSLHWVGIENGEVAVLRGDGQLLPTELAENLVDKAWEKISRYVPIGGIGAPIFTLKVIVVT